MFSKLSRRSVVTLAAVSSSGIVAWYSIPVTYNDGSVKEKTPEPAKNTLLKKCLFESLGTGVIVGLGCGCVGSSKYLASGLSLGGISLSWGLTVALAVYATREQSGAHLNPAITAALASTGNFPMEEVPFYWLAQLVGASTAAAINYAIFAPAIKVFEETQKLPRGSPGSSAVYNGAFGMVPNPAIFRGAGRVGPLLVEALATGSLSYLIHAITDPRSNIGGDAAPLLVGSTVAVLVSVFGPITGAGMNPARDLGPRLVSYFAGWRAEALRSAHVYTVGPFTGAIAGAWLYRTLNSPDKPTLKVD